MEVLSFTTLWPNHMQPFHGLFVRERIKALHKLCQIKVVAPVPWFPPIRFLGEQYYIFSRIKPWEQQDQIKVLHPKFFTLPKIFKSLDGLFMFKSLLPFFRKQNFGADIIDAHWAYPDGYAAGLLAERLGLPYTVTVRGSDVNVFAKEKRRGALILKSLSGAKRVICVSDSLKEELLNLGIPEEKTCVVENGVDHVKFSRVSCKEARHHLNLPQDVIILLSIGYIDELKGFHLIIQGLKDLQSKIGKKVYFFIVGRDLQTWYKESMLRQIVEKGLDNQVLFMGPKNPEELKYWYSAADIFCLASSREGCPNVILESLACGTPVVASNVGGIPKIVKEPFLGILAERDTDSIRTALTRALRRQWDHQCILNHVKKEYSWERTAKKIYTIFETIRKEEK